MLTAWALVHAPSVPWSGLNGIGRVAQASGVPAPLTLSGPAARAPVALPRATATTARASNRRARTTDQPSRGSVGQPPDLGEEAVEVLLAIGREVTVDPRPVCATADPV